MRQTLSRTLLAAMGAMATSYSFALPPIYPPQGVPSLKPRLRRRGIEFLPVELLRKGMYHKFIQASTLTR